MIILHLQRLLIVSGWVCMHVRAGENGAEEEEGQTGSGGLGLAPGTERAWTYVHPELQA